MVFDKKRVFISYAREDKAFAEQLHEQLQKYGLEVWLDLQNVPPGTDWASHISRELQRADGLLLIMSPDSKASQNVEVEWKQMLAAGKPILPLRLRDYGLSFHPDLDRLSYTDISSQTEAFPYKFRRVLDGLKAQGYAVKESLTEGPYQMKPQAAPAANRLQLPLLIGGIVIVAAVIAFLLMRPTGNGASSATSTPTDAPVAATNPPASDTSTPTNTMPANPTATPQTTTNSGASSPGSLDIRLIYSGPESLVVIVEAASDFDQVGLLPAGAEEPVNLIERFDGLQLSDGEAEAGACLRFIQAGETPPLPTDCESSKLLSVQVSTADVFWWDTVSNQPRSMTVERGDTRVGICSAASAAGSGCAIQG